MTNITALFTRSIQCSSSTVMVMMLSMNPSIDDSVSVISTARGSAFTGWFSGCCLSSFGSKVLCGEMIFYGSHNSSLNRLFPRYIAAFLIVVYSYGADVVKKGNYRHRKASLSTTDM